MKLTYLKSYLVAINLHDWGPSSISTSKISNVAVDGKKFRIYFERNKLTPGQTVGYKETSTYIARGFQGTRSLIPLLCHYIFKVLL